MSLTVVPSIPLRRKTRSAAVRMVSRVRSRRRWLRLAIVGVRPLMILVAIESLICRRTGRAYFEGSIGKRAVLRIYDTNIIVAAGRFQGFRLGPPALVQSQYLYNMSLLTIYTNWR